ncbi:hypothetical protein [Polyangium sp. 15x6]|uniref:hypothetical protein n=1 Tax=Polyangium sp. 15x6 TaxID=3042687 RepID=UPI00249BD6B8|nr:hypothetical protein [Polyangium sp. 15x6]MDI3290081.1 hypothetical protein [Polyangium sp. 15x6]
MLCFLDGRSFDPAHLSFREMGTGGVPAELLHEVKLVFGRDELVALLSPTYAEFVRELDLDVKLMHDADEDEQAYLRHAALAELFDGAPSALPGLMRDSLWDDLLGLCFGKNSIERCTHVLDTFVSLELCRSDVVIVATAFVKRQPARGTAP